MKKNQKKSLIQIVAIAMLTAISFVLFLLEFPLFAALGHLKMDLSDIPALFAGVVYGPGAAVIIELLKNVIELVFKGIGTQMGFGNLMNFIVGCAYVLPFSFIMRKNKDKMKETKTISVSGICGLLCIVIIGVGANYFVAPLFFKYFMNVELDSATLWTAVGSATALNAIKGVMLTVIAFPIVKGMLDTVRKIAGKM